MIEDQVRELVADLVSATESRSLAEQIYGIDHVARYADGGPTVSSNGQGLAVGDHHLRDLPDWTVAGDADGAG